MLLNEITWAEHEPLIYRVVHNLIKRGELVFIDHWDSSDPGADSSKGEVNYLDHTTQGGQPKLVVAYSQPGVGARVVTFPWETADDHITLNKEDGKWVMRETQ